MPNTESFVAAANVAQNAINNIAISGRNRKERQWQEKMYAKQREDAIADWNRINNYNLPANQMKRFQEAGLNPNLIYGQGNAGNAENIRSSSPGSISPQPLEFNIASGLNQYYDLTMKNTQIDNLELLGEVYKEDKNLRIAQVLKLMADTGDKDASAALKKFTLGLKEELRDNSIEQASVKLENMRKTGLSIDSKTAYTLNENERRNVLASANIYQAVEKVLLMQKQRLEIASRIELNATKRQHMNSQIGEITYKIANLYRDGTLKDYELKARQKGYSWGDSFFWRTIGNTVGSVTENYNNWNDKKQKRYGKPLSNAGMDQTGKRKQEILSGASHRIIF